MNSKPGSVDEYLACVPDDARATLEELCGQIKAVAPDAVESISYGVPTFKYQGRPLASFAAAKNHCAVYGLSVDEHREDLAGYDTSKGTIRFPPGEPLPEALVRMLLSERVAAIEAAAAGRKRKKSDARTSG